MPSLSRRESGRFRYGFVGLSDRRMVPLLRPGSTVVIDTACRNIEDEDWSNESDRPRFPGIADRLTLSNFASLCSSFSMRSRKRGITHGCRRFYRLFVKKMPSTFSSWADPV
jgi:hypothetical protein